MAADLDLPALIAWHEAQEKFFTRGRDEATTAPIRSSYEEDIAHEQQTIAALRQLQSLQATDHFALRIAAELRADRAEAQLQSQGAAIRALPIPLLLDCVGHLLDLTPTTHSESVVRLIKRESVTRAELKDAETRLKALAGGQET